MSNKSFLQGRFTPELFTEVLNGPSTYRVAYLRAHLCPNKGERGGHVTDCPVCGGLGYYWEDVTQGGTRHTQELTRASLYGDERLNNVPTQIIGITDEDGNTYPPSSIEVGGSGEVSWLDGLPKPADYRLYTVEYETSQLRALVQGVTTQREFAIRGEFDVTDIQITVDRYLEDNETLNPLWNAGEHDRVVLLDTWRRHTQHLQRGVQDTTVYRRLKDVRLTSVVNGKIQEWEEGVDFTVDDGDITWLSGHGPKNKSHYALEAQASPEYYVFQSLPQTRHMDSLDMPRRFVLRGFENHPSQKPSTAVRGQR